MGYTKVTFINVVETLGEVTFVLDSGQEYTIHGRDGFDFENYSGRVFVHAEGMIGEEYVDVEFPLDKIEHHYTHREL